MGIVIYLAIGIWVAFTTRLVVGADERWKKALYLYLVVAWPIMVIAFVVIGIAYSFWEISQGVRNKFNRKKTACQE